MLLRFTKMHGLGNDFVVLDLITQRFQIKPGHVRKLADRRLGVGCDQVLVVEPPGRADADFRYRIFNADGSEVGQCGNGARCFARFVYDKHLTGSKRITVETCSGLLTLELLDNRKVRVDMGIPSLEPEAIPFRPLEQRRSATYSIPALGRDWSVSAVSMGNPHAILMIDDVDRAPVADLGPALESHPQFPERVNVGFLQIVDRHHARLRVYERGAGETQACGSGACAAVVAGRLAGALASPVEVSLPGGELSIEWQGEGHAVMMTGPAVTVFEGQFRL